MEIIRAIADHKYSGRYVDNQILTRSTHLRARQDVIDGKGGKVVSNMTNNLEDYDDALDMIRPRNRMLKCHSGQVSESHWLTKFSAGSSSKDAIGSYRYLILLKTITPSHV